MAIAEKVRKSMVTGSVIRKMFEEGMILKKKYGEDKVFDLTIGNPTLEPPREFNQEIQKPQGTFYLFPESPISDDVIFVNDLLACKVLVTPGLAFGGPGHFRIAYCLEDKVLEGSLDGFREVFRKYSK